MLATSMPHLVPVQARPTAARADRPSNGKRDVNRLTNVIISWQPFPAYQIAEVVNSLKGVLPQSPTLSINPENRYFVK
jgi:hypothetical protein